MKKRFATILSAVLLLSASSSAFASDNSSISQKDAEKAAVQFIEQQQKFYPQWKDLGELQVKPEKVLHDFDGNVNAYLFSVKKNNEDHGYIIESATLEHPGLLEAQTGGTHPFSNISDEQSIYVGPAAFYKKESKDSFYDLKVGQKIERKSLKSNGAYSKENLKKSKAIIQTNAVAAAATTDGGYISNVIELFTVPGKGCVPTAGATLVSYWKDRSFPNLMKSSSGATLTTTQVIDQLHIDMNTSSSGGTYSTPAKVGMNTYWSNHGGYKANAQVISGSTMWNTQKTEIKNKRPTIIGVSGHPTMGEHAVTGIGFAELDNGTKNAIVHDNLDSNNNDTIYPFDATTSWVMSVSPSY